MIPTWLVLLPPLIVLASAFVFKHLIPAFIIGLLSASFIAVQFSFEPAINLLVQRIVAGISDVDTLYNFSFLFAIGVFVSLLNKTGGATAFARSLTKKLRSTTMVENVVIPLSLVLGLDDYLNTLTVAYVMRPLTDLFKIPRAKLAFLVQSMAGPLVILIPLSSWAAMISGQLEFSAISPVEGSKIMADPFFVYLRSIPFIFFSLFIIASVWFIIQWKISFGLMQTHEKIATATGNLYGGKKSLDESSQEDMSAHGELSDIILPLSTLLCCVMLGITWSGDYYLFGGNHSLIEAFKYNTQTAWVLFSSSIITLCIGFIQALIKKRITFKDIPITITSGIHLMYSPILVVFLASTLGLILRSDLQTGPYLAHLLLGSVSPMLLPFMIFITSSIISLAIGSAWGTISLMLPIAIPLFLTFVQIQTPASLATVPMLFPVLGAVFSGAVVGDLISPVSGAAIMAASSSGCYPLDHTITQGIYAIPAFIGSCAAFLFSGCYTCSSLSTNNIVSFAIGLFVTLGTIMLLNTRRNTLI